MRTRFPPVQADEPISARQENRIRDFLNSLQSLVNSGGIDAVQACGLTMLRRPVLPPTPLYAQILGNGFDTDGVYCYSWEIMEPGPNGSFTTVTDGISGGPAGTPLYEKNGAQGIADGTIVRIWAGYNNEDTGIEQEYLFDESEGAGDFPASEWLTATNQSLQVVLAEAATTSECAWTAVYCTDTGTNQAVLEGRTTGTTPKVMIPGADDHVTASVHIAIQNGDTIDHTVTVQLDDNGNIRKVVSALLAPGDSLLFDAEGADWYVSQGTDVSPVPPFPPTPPFIGNITVGPNVTWNWLGPTYVTFGPNVRVQFQFPLSIVACLIMGGEQPDAPTNPPTVTVGGGGSGFWESGNYFAKISFVDDSGAESEPSPETSMFSTPGSPDLKFDLNNTPAADTEAWRIYVTPKNGASGSETGQEANVIGATTIYDVPIATTTFHLPGPYKVGPDPEGAATSPASCFLPPSWCGKPTWSAQDCEIVMDTCSVPPTIWEQRTSPSGSNWQSIIGTTTKGDLIVGGPTSGNGAILPVGTDGYIPQAFASLTNGVGWAQLVQGTGITITNVAGTITIATSGGGGGMTNPMTDLGDMICGDPAGTPATPKRVPPNITTTKKFLTMTGTGSVGADPTWGTIASGDLPSGTASCHLISVDGTTNAGTDPQAFIPTTSSASGIIGNLSVTNLGSNDIQLSLTLTDAFGNSSVGGIATVSHLAGSNTLTIDLDDSRSAAGVFPPYVLIAAAIQAAVSGQNSSFKARAVLVY